MTIAPVGERDLADLLPLLRAYCDFYAADPPDDALAAYCRALLADPQREGVMLLARAGDEAAVGFATLLWTWSTLRAARIGVMNDLFVAPAARGTGVGEALIAACRERAREHGAAWLGWQTAADNRTAQRLYERAGAERSQWIDYGLRP